MNEEAKTREKAKEDYSFMAFVNGLEDDKIAMFADIKYDEHQMGVMYRAFTELNLTKEQVAVVANPELSVNRMILTVSEMSNGLDIEKAKQLVSPELTDNQARDMAFNWRNQKMYTMTGKEADMWQNLGKGFAKETHENIKAGFNMAKKQKTEKEMEL